MRRTTRGDGMALCECGWTSPALPSGGKRRAHHAEHKANLSVDARPSSE